MRAHVAHLESELAVATQQLNVIELGAADRARGAQDAIDAWDYSLARDALLRDHVTGEPLDEKIGVLEADIRVLGILLGECHEWLRTLSERS